MLKALYILSHWDAYILPKQFLRIRVLYPHLGKDPHSPLGSRRPDHKLSKEPIDFFEMLLKPVSISMPIRGDISSIIGMP